MRVFTTLNSRLGALTQVRHVTETSTPTEGDLHGSFKKGIENFYGYYAIALLEERANVVYRRNRLYVVSFNVHHPSRPILVNEGSKVPV